MCGDYKGINESVLQSRSKRRALWFMYHVVCSTNIQYPSPYVWSVHSKSIAANMASAETTPAICLENVSWLPPEVVVLPDGADDVEVPEEPPDAVAVPPADTELDEVVAFDVSEEKARIEPISKYAVAKSDVPLLITLSAY